jgi:Fe-S-cluster-containing dehydrogenase component/DMSO reductase anchor subunit
MVAPRHSETTAPASSLESFLAELIADQQKLQTPVTRAATAHELQPSAWRAERFRELIPLTAPAPGQQYAFEVDLDSCSGCKACVSGCHSLNGLDEEETWRDVGLVFGVSDRSSFSQTVTTACHHCADPACLNGCPVLAYEKDPLTGIVRHLDDQCIGCSYCVLKCPYDVPKYNERLGIVRKCDMCHGRLAAGEAPACAQACPTQAIRIVHVSTHSAETSPDGIVSLPADPTYTRPTTRYVSDRPLPTDLRPADADAIRPQHAHLALVFLLVGTQIASGLLLSAWILGKDSRILNGAAAILYFAALAASVAHLGQPFRAWRIFLGLRRSWLSREAVLLGAAAPLVALNALRPFFETLALPPALAVVLGPTAITLTMAGILSSCMIYIDTRRHFWRPLNTFVRMGGTVLISALAFVAPAGAAVALVVKLAGEIRLLRASRSSARLYDSVLRAPSRLRILLGIAASALFAFGYVIAGFIVFTAGELIERVLYFRAVDAPKMPGQPAA